MKDTKVIFNSEIENKLTMPWVKRNNDNYHQINMHQNRLNLFMKCPLTNKVDATFSTKSQHKFRNKSLPNAQSKLK